MPKPRRKSFGAACHAISSTAEFEEGQDDDDFDSDSESCSSEPPMDDPKSPSSDEEEDVIDPGMSVHITDDAITPECMAKLQPTVLLEDCLSPNVSRQNTASPVPLNNDWKPSPLAGTQKQSEDNRQQPRRQQRSDRRALKTRERSGSPVHNLLSRILTKKTGIETVLSPLSKDKPSGDKSPEAAPSPDSLNPDSPGESSAREGLEENKTSTVTPLKENLALTRTRLTSSPAVYESPTKSQFTRVHGSLYPPGSPQMSPVVVLHDCCTPPRGTRQTRAQRMASWYVEEDDDDDDEMAELLEKEEEEEEDVFPEPLSTSAESFFGRKIEATVEIHGETLAESSLYHSLSCSSKRRQALLAPVPTRRARYSLRHAKQHFKNGCIINGNDEITFISSTKTTAKELLKETRRRQRSLHFTPSPVHRRNKRFKGEGKTGDPPSRMSTRLQRQRAPVTSSPEESQDDCLTAEELPPTSEDPMEDPAGLHDQSNVVFYDEVILCPEEDDFQEDSSTAELPHSSWSLSPPTTRPQSTGSESPPIREEPCCPPPITELLTSQSPPITVCQPTRSESPPIREEPCSPPPIIELLTSRSPPITVHQSPRSESPPIREEPCNKGFESPPIREEPSSSVTVVQPITDHNSTTGSNFQPIMEQESRAGSENPPITEEETTTEPHPIIDQPSNFESQSPPIKSQTSLSKSSPSPNTVEHPTTALPSRLNNSLQTIKDQSPSSSDKSENDSSRIQSPILEEEEDDTYEEPETEPLRYVTVSRRGHEDTPLPGRRLSSRVAQALADEASITSTQVGQSHQTVEQSQDHTTSIGGRKSSRDALKQKRKPTRQQNGTELVAEETGQEKEEENTKNDLNVVEVQGCGLDENETSDKECHAPDVAMATSDVAMETSSIPEEEPIGDIPEIVFKGTAENNVETAEVSQREANFSDTTKGGEDIIVEHEEEEEAEPKRPRRFRKPAAKPAPSSAVKLRKGRGRKQEEDIEVIYRNKNYKAPEQKTFETIYEDPIVRKKTGEEQLVGRSMKRRVSFRNFYYPKKMNKKKASKNVKRFRRKSLEGVTVDEKLINLDRQMIGISPAKFCLPGDQMLFQFASDEASSDLVTVKEEPLDLLDEENHQALDLSGVGPLDEEEEKGITQELTEIENKEVLHSQGQMLQEETEQQAEKDSPTTVTRKPGRKRRRSSLTAQAKIKVLENISQINSESDDHMPRNSKPKKSRRKSSSVKQDSCVSLSDDMSKETSGSSSETTEEVEASRLPEHVSLASSESATTSELEGEVTQGKKRGRRKSIKSGKPVNTASTDRQASDLNSVDLAINAVVAGKYFEEPPNQTTQQATSEASQASIQDVSTTQQTSKEAKKRRRSCVLSVPVEPPQDDLQNADGKGRGQKAKTKGQANGKGSNPEGKIEVETTAQSADALGLTEEDLRSVKGKTARQRSRRRSLLLSQQSSSVEDENERNTEASNSEEEKLASSQEPAKKKTSTRRKSVLPPTVEDASSTTEGQNSTEDESSSSVSVKKRGRRRSTVSTTKQDAAEDFSQQSRLTEEQTLEEGYSTESSVTSVVVRRRSRRKSVLLQQSSSEDCSQPAKEQGTESLDSDETASTSVAKKRSRRRSVVVQRSGSLSEEGMEAGQWSGSELSCDVPLPENRSVKTRKTRRQDIIPGSSTCLNVERAMSESEESHVSTASGPVTTRRSRRRSVLLKTSLANEEDSRPPDNVSPIRKTAKQHVESLGEAGVTSTVLKEEASSISAEHQTDDKTGQIEEPQVDRKEHQLENDVNPWGCSSQESASSQSVGGFGEFVEDEASGISRRKRKRRKSVLLKQFSWAGESPPGSAPISEKFGTKAEEKKQTEETLPSCSQQTREEGVENVPDSQESDDVVSFNLEVSRKQTELKEVHSDAEATDSEAILPAKKAKRSLCGNDEEKNQTSDSSESVVDSQPQVSTKTKRRKSVCKKATNEEKIVTSSTDIPQDILNNDDYDELQSTEVQSDLQTVTQATRRQKRKRVSGPVVSSSEEMSASEKEDKTETSKSQDLPTDIGNEESLSSTGKVEETMSEDQVSEKQPKRKGRRKSQSFRPQKLKKFLTENQDAESTTPNQTEEDFVTRDKTYTDEKHTEITDEPKRKVRRQSARFRRASTPKKMASPKTTPPPDNDLMFEDDFVTNDDTFIDNEQIESLINSIAEGSTPVGSPCHSVSTKIADVNVEKDIKKKPGQKKAKTRKKNAGKRAGTRGRKKAEPPKTPKEASPQNRKPAKTPTDSSPQNSKPTSTVSPKLRVAESNKTASPVESEENGLQYNTCSVRKEKKAKKGGNSLSPATNDQKIHENGDKTTAMLSPTSQNSLKKTPANKTPSSALQSHTDKGKSSQKSSPTTPSQSQKCKVVVKEPPHSPETVFSPKSRDQARQISSLFSVLSRSTSSPDPNQSLLGAMPSFKSLVKDVVSPETTVNSSQPTPDTSCDTRKPSKQTSFASKGNSGSKSANNTPYSSSSSKPGLLAEQTPQAESCDTDVASSFSYHGNTSWKDTTVSNSGKSKSFTFAKAYSAKQHWAKRFMNTKDTYLNKFKMFAFGSPSSQSSAED